MDVVFLGAQPFLISLSNQQDGIHSHCADECVLEARLQGRDSACLAARFFFFLVGGESLFIFVVVFCLGRGEFGGWVFRFRAEMGFPAASNR